MARGRTITRRSPSRPRTGGSTRTTAGRTTPKAARRAAIGGSTKKKATRAAIAAGGASILRSIPVIGGVAGGVMDAKAAYDQITAQGISPAKARAMSGYHPRKQGILNKRSKKTIRQAIKYYRQLSKAMRGIEKMAGRARIPKGRGGFRPYRGQKIY